MTQDEIIEMARRAGFDPHDMSSDFTCNLKDINSFAKLVAQHAKAEEREACAKVCEDKNTLLAWPTFATAIRARGQA
jgi:hypothetical protein